MSEEHHGEENQPLVVQSNCIGYVYFSLGLTSEEVVISGMRLPLLDIFEPVADIEEADALAVISKFLLGRDPECRLEIVSHMALVDQSVKYPKS